MKRFQITIAAPGSARTDFVGIAHSSADLVASLIDRLPLGSFVCVRAL